MEKASSIEREDAEDGSWGGATRVGRDAAADGVVRVVRDPTIRLAAAAVARDVMAERTERGVALRREVGGVLGVARERADFALLRRDDALRAMPGIS